MKLALFDTRLASELPIQKLKMNNQIPIHVRFKDIDMNQHVNNAVYFTYMETARAELLMESFLSYYKQNILIVVAEATCKYKRPIRLDDKIVCTLQLELTGALHFTITYYFKDATTDILYAEGKTKMVMVHKESNRPIKVPDELINTHLK